ncbi:MAG: hypothetical protein JWM71_264 [Solirubrobacteraceae bacterium]|nr:hypothetical protein [Solirubrobacteraceae bacterium]
MVIPARVSVCLVVLAGAVPLAGCGSHAAAVPGPVVRVGEHDFRIVAPATVRAGTVTISDTNRGPDTHELFVVREPAHTTLPLRADGLTIDEDAIKRETVGNIDGITPGHRADLRLHLAAGRYVLFCNMAGHYLGGMHRTLIVR